VQFFTVVSSGTGELNDLQKIEETCCGTEGEDRILMTYGSIFSFRCSTSRYTEVADVIFHILQILLLDENEKADVFFEES
jgi:hypothetical protein